jgi:hypothetical protein
MGKSKSLLLRLRDRNTPNGVTRKTLARLARTLGVSETDAIHKALAESARTNLPQYEPDDGPLTGRQEQRIDELTRRTRETYRETESLFGEPGARDEKNDRKRVPPAPRPR